MSISTTDASPGLAVSARTPIGVAALAGLGWFIAGFGSTTPDGPEAGTASAEQVRTYVADNTDTLQMNAVSMMVGVVAIVVMVAAFARIIETGRPGSVLPGAVRIGGAIAAVNVMALLAIDCVWLMLDESIGKLSDASVVTLYDVSALAHALSSVALPLQCVFVVGLVSFAAWHGRFLSRPVAVLGLLIGVAGAASALEIVSTSSAFAAPFFFALFGWFLWPAVAGVDLGIRWVKGRRA